MLSTQSFKSIKSLKSVLASLLFIGLSAIALSCTRHTGKITPMPAMEAYGMLRNDFAALVDLRDPDQQKEGVAQGALSMPAANLDPSKLPKGKRIIVYGASADQAGKAAEQLAAQGFDVGVIGTYNDWVQAKLPTQKP